MTKVILPGGKVRYDVTFTSNVPGAWGVDAIGGVWCVINRVTGGVKRIGRVSRPRSQSKINYFDRAIAEADRRNRIDAAVAEAGKRVAALIAEATITGASDALATINADKEKQQ
jgi:hypothetical protein